VADELTQVLQSSPDQELEERRIAAEWDEIAYWSEAATSLRTQYATKAKALAVAQVLLTLGIGIAAALAAIRTAGF
jgi:hypothetical protein